MHTATVSGEFWERSTEVGIDYLGMSPDGSHIYGYENLLAAEGMGPIEPTDAASLHDQNTRYELTDGGIDFVAGSYAVRQLLDGAGLSLRQFRVIHALIEVDDFTDLPSELEALKSRIDDPHVEGVHRVAKGRIQRANGPDESVFRMPAKGIDRSQNKELRSEQSDLMDRVIADFEHVHGGDLKKQQVMYSMIRAVTRSFVNNPTHQDRVVVEKIMLGYWSLDLFSRIARNARVRHDSMDQEYMKAIRRYIVSDAVNHMRRLMESGEIPSLHVPEQEALHDPDISHAMDWYDPTQRKKRAAGRAREEAARRARLERLRFEEGAQAVEEVDASADEDTGRGWRSRLRWPRKRG